MIKILLCVNIIVPQVNGSGKSVQTLKHLLADFRHKPFANDGAASLAGLDEAIECASYECYLCRLFIVHQNLILIIKS